MKSVAKAAWRLHAQRGRDVVVLLLTVLTISRSSAARAQGDLPDAKPVPATQVVPLPYDQASFQLHGRELTRYHFGRALVRPFCYPVMGPDGRSLTRMGHPHDPESHSHHNSVWISHHDVGGVDFWGDRGGGRIVHQRILQYDDADERAGVLSLNHWNGPQGETLLVEHRRVTVEPLAEGSWRMLIDLQLASPGDKPVTLGQTPFGLIGVRMAKTIGVRDGGGRILNSAGQLNEEQVFRKPARWVDYSGPITRELRGGITLMDHPQNPGHPNPFHVRGDGWMGICLTLDRPLPIPPGKPLRLRYGLWVHGGVPQPEQVSPQWDTFVSLPRTTMQRAGR